MNKSMIFRLLTYLCFFILGGVLGIMEYQPLNDWEWWAVLTLMSLVVLFKDLEKDAEVLEDES